eukprot:SAG22_NODE_216_length_14937_cov_51.622995_12_plen_332_part_00
MRFRCHRVLREEWEESASHAAARVEQHEKEKKLELQRLASEEYAKLEEARKAVAEKSEALAAEKVKANAEKFAAAAARAEGIAKEQEKQNMVRVEEDKLRRQKKEAHVSRMLRKQANAVSDMEEKLEAKLRRADAANLEKKLLEEARASASKRFFVERRKMVHAQEQELQRLRFGASYYPGPDGPDAKPKLTPRQQAQVRPAAIRFGKALPLPCVSTVFLSKTVPFLVISQQQVVARLAKTDRAARYQPQPPRQPRGGSGGSKEDEGRGAEGTDSGGGADGDGGGGMEDDREDGGHAPEYHELLGMMARAKQWMLQDLGEDGGPQVSQPAS